MYVVGTHFVRFCRENSHLQLKLGGEKSPLVRPGYSTVRSLVCITYDVLVEVRLCFAVGDASHCLIVVELVAQLAEVPSHRDHMLHAYTPVICQSLHHQHCQKFTGIRNYTIDVSIGLVARVSNS